MGHALHAAADAFEAELDAHEAATTELAGPHAEPAAPAEAQAQDHPLAGVAGIISPVVGAHVAHAFEQLAIAVDSKPRRSFDEIAQDMLRPMLQEWMDDNLPTLVERLVREEIERWPAARAADGHAASAASLFRRRRQHRSISTENRGLRRPLKCGPSSFAALPDPVS